MVSKRRRVAETERRKGRSTSVIAWIGLDWIGLDLIGLDWTGSDWIAASLTTLGINASTRGEERVSRLTSVLHHVLSGPGQTRLSCGSRILVACTRTCTRRRCMRTRMRPRHTIHMHFCIDALHNNSRRTVPTSGRSFLQLMSWL